MVQRLDNFYLAVAVQTLSRYFSLTTPQENASTLAFQAIQGFSDRYPNERLRSDPIISNMMDLIVNSNFGAVPIYSSENSHTTDLLSAIQNFTTRPQNSETFTQNGRSVLENFSQKVRIFHGAPNLPNDSSRPWSFNVMNQIIGRDNDPILPRLGVITLNTPQISPQNRYTEAISIFMNGIPSIEMARAVPYINVDFHFGREAINLDGRLNAPSIFKFLEGAVNVTNGSPLSVLALSNRISGSLAGGANQTGYLSTAGMELFTSPQTMVNADTPNPTSNRSDAALRTVPVLDKFRPFATFKNLIVEVAPSAGLMSYKTAKMEFILHDRSRLHEIADLIRPDLYGANNTEIIIEYGWSHPDKPSSGNPFAVLLNCTRIKEKYRIRNMNLGIDEVGQANITLDLFMAGANEFATESIGTASEGTQRSLQTIERLAETIRTLRERVFRNNSSNQSGNNSNSGGGSNREIRGTQILEAASDIQNNIRLTPGILENLDQLRNSLRTNNNRPEVQNLISNLTALYNTHTSRNRVSQNSQSARGDGAVAELQRSIQEEIQRKIDTLRGTPDPFYPPDTYSLPGTSDTNGNAQSIQIGNISVNPNQRARFRRVPTTNSNGRRAIPQGQSQGSGGNGRRPPPINIPSVYNNTFFTLGKLITSFVGQPLASHTDRFSSVQFLFYPFNAYAGYANGLNISQFMIDARYFIEKYVRFRTESISRAANVTLNEFMQFIATVIIDDVGAATYGIDDLYERTLNRETGEQSLQPRGNSVNFQTRLENRLRSVTPDGSFRMPHISFYIEALPRRIVNLNASQDQQTGNYAVQNPEDTENSQTILRIHIFDQQTTQYEGQNGLLAASRDNALNSIAAIPASNNNGEPAILDGHRAQIRQIIEMASSADGGNLIEPMQPVPNVPIPPNGLPYRINGGGNAIKEFVMKTMPYIIYGAQGTNVIHANISSQHEPALSTVNMLRNNRASPIRANGEQFGGLPLTVIPMELSLTTLGCSLLSFGQQIFVDLKTGTSIDNIYGISGITHKLEPGNFTSEIKFVPLDAFGRYNSFLERINNFVTNLQDIQAGSTRQNNPNSSLNNSSPSQTTNH